jgi:Zn-finger nucleic acid-binding protein
LAVPADAPSGLTETSSCPRCQIALESAELRGVPIRACKKCSGSLLAQVDLARLLGAMSVDLLKTFDPDKRLAPVLDQGGSLCCPRCRETMTNDDYCGAGLVHFDRCEHCGLLWLDAGELGTMSLMWARMETRLDRVEAESRARLREVDDFVDTVLLARVVADIMFRALH